ncbi:MAG TPA: PQQ-binding-like beta-propeller repeat protein [Candidatus Binatia bacterium]|nr:PQQ-binding-like beta-propeller repeat protein [Candidatus Binatia bacterium]
MRSSSLIVTVWVVFACVSSALSQTGSVTYQVSPAHTGEITTTGLKPPLTVKWSVSVQGTASYPVIADGMVFVIGGGTETSPSTLYGLNGTTGATVWTQAVPSGFGSWIGAAYENGALFVITTETPGFSAGGIFAFAARTGKQLWSANLSGQYSFSSSPTALNGVVYTGGAGEGGTVYAVSEKNGETLWTASVENGDSSNPAVTSNGVYVSYVCPQTYRFNPGTGKQEWHFSGPCEGGGGETAVVYDGLVYVRDLVNNYPTDGITLNASTGAMVGGFNSMYMPVFLGTTAFYTEPDTVTAVSLTNGDTLWTAVAAAGQTYSCSPLVVNGVVYTGTSNGDLVGYSSKNGSQIFSMNVGSTISCGEYFAIPQAGMGAGAGLLVVPAGSQVVALQ